jgi:hypothetical protein
MFRCAGVVLVLALVFFPQGVAAEPLVDAYGIIQGVVWGELEQDTVTREGATVSVEVDDTTLTDQTDSQGRYTLSIPLHDEDSRTVTVNADLGRYIEADSTVVVTFGQVRVLDFLLRKQAQIITGFVKDLVFDTGIESVYVFMGDSARSTHTINSGQYWLIGLDAGTYDISFNHPDFLPETTTVTIVIPDPPDPPLAIHLDETLEQIIWHVDGILGDDDEGVGDGRVLSPFATIKKAIEFVTEGDIVLVEPGIYTGDMNTEITINGTDPEFTLKSSDGAEVTTIRCQPDPQQRGIQFTNVGPLTVFDGFTISDGYNTSGGAINCFEMASPTIINCILRNNEAFNRGGAILIDDDSSPIIRNCLFDSNEAKHGSAIAIMGTSSPLIDSCVIINNRSTSNTGRGGGIFINGSSPSIRNCTLAGNWAGPDTTGGGIYHEDGAENAHIARCIIWGNQPDGIFLDNSDPIVDTSDVQGDGIWGGNDNMNEHPLFCDPNDDDFYLAKNSPCYNHPEDGEYIGARGMGCDTLGIISGVVVEDDENRYPIEGVEVVASDFDGTSDTKTDFTDIYGKYELSIPIIYNSVNSADVLFSHSAYIDFMVQDIVFIAGDSTQLDTAMVKGCEYIPGDVDDSGVSGELSDITAMIAIYCCAFPPPFVCDCPPYGEEFAAAADPNGNCIAMELADVQFMISAYRGNVTAAGCWACPGVQRMPPGSREEPLVVPSLKSKVKINRGGLTQ